MTGNNAAKAMASLTLWLPCYSHGGGQSEARKDERGSTAEQKLLHMANI